MALAAEAPAPREAGGSPSLDRAVYDRSSLQGAYMVMIADQSEDDYFRLAPEDQFCEYIDGVVYMPSPVGRRHQQVVQFLLTLLECFRERKGAGPILSGPAVLRLGERRNVEPDLFVLPVGAEPRVHQQYSEGPAALVVEVLSESTRHHDLQRKTLLYREAGTREIWLVDGLHRELLIERKVGEGYRAERLTEGVARCEALPGFWIDAAWLWADPLPGPLSCLERILAGPPA